MNGSYATRDQRPPRRYRHYRDVGASAAYTYTDEAGRPLFQALRMPKPGGGKTFNQARAIPDGWEFGLGDVRRVLYGLPRLLAADPDEWVYLPEGEKDVETLWKQGFVATTNAMGAKKWLPEYTESLRGRRVVILPDNDKDGEDHLAVVRKALIGIASDVRVLRLPNLPPKGDVTDWFTAGGTPDNLRELTDTHAVSLDSEAADETSGDAPKFPLEILPPAIAAYVDDAARSLSCPPEMVAVPLLALAGSLIGNRLHLELKNSWREYPTLYVAVVAPPGSAKTPALSAAQWPLDALQDDEERKHRIRREDYESQLETWRQDRSGDKPALPAMRHYFSTNLTLEALVAMLAHSPGIAIVRDEILGWVQSMDEYKAKGSDRQEYLSLWSCRTIKADRKGSEPIYRRFPVACVIGGIQPDLVGGLHHAAKQRDGFVERILPIVPDCAPAPWNEEAISPERYTDVLHVFRDLDIALDAQPASGSGLTTAGDDGLGARRIVGRPVTLSASARSLWVSWFNDNAQLIGAADGGLVAGFYSKLPTQVARLALILHALRNPEKPDLLLAASTMEDAIALGEFFRAHIGKFLALLGTTAPHQSAGIATRILRILRISEQEADDRWVRRSAILNGLRNVPATELTIALDVLQAQEKIEHRTLPGTTKPTEQWRLLDISPPFGYSDYSEYPGQEGRKSEYSEYPNGRSDHEMDLVEAEWVEVGRI